MFDYNTTDLASERVPHPALSACLAGSTRAHFIFLKNDFTAIVFSLPLNALAADILSAQRITATTLIIVFEKCETYPLGWFIESHSNIVCLNGRREDLKRKSRSALRTEFGWGDMCWCRKNVFDKKCLCQARVLLDFEFRFSRNLLCFLVHLFAASEYAQLPFVAR